MNRAPQENVIPWYSGNPNNGDPASEEIATNLLADAPPDTAQKQYHLLDCYTDSQGEKNVDPAQLKYIIQAIGHLSYFHKKIEQYLHKQAWKQKEVEDKDKHEDEEEYENEEEYYINELYNYIDITHLVTHIMADEHTPWSIEDTNWYIRSVIIKFGSIGVIWERMRQIKNAENETKLRSLLEITEQNLNELYTYEGKKSIIVSPNEYNAIKTLLHAYQYCINRVKTKIRWLNFRLRKKERYRFSKKRYTYDQIKRYQETRGDIWFLKDVVDIHNSGLWSLQHLWSIIDNVYQQNNNTISINILGP